LSNYTKSKRKNLYSRSHSLALTFTEPEKVIGTSTTFEAGGDIASGAKESINLKGSSLLSEAGSVALRAGRMVGKIVTRKK
jgi:hypothetical protein